MIQQPLENKPYFSNKQKTIFWRNDGKTESQEAEARHRISKKLKINTDNGDGGKMLILRVKNKNNIKYDGAGLKRAVCLR